MRRKQVVFPGSTPAIQCTNLCHRCGWMCVTQETLRHIPRLVSVDSRKPSRYRGRVRLVLERGERERKKKRQFLA
ncbi:hypothetical protein E2C01_035275 [Portunus trituberculatus]|uniref:Uncharacterized protein n=1 Tax=Portunus trituberculatus TaxID=210409 RepID=A0A5B7FB15_PORTR|nr:hypothetical protein [Portunus trituberculatus]